VAAELVALEQVRAEILGAVGVLDPVDVPLAEAHGLVLAATVMTTEDVPPFANTAMDGYAVRAADTSGASPDSAVTLRVVGDLPAGRAPDVEVGAGDAIRIMTGAPMPIGADAVVMVERTETAGDDVAILAEARTGDHVRSAGGDLRSGQEVFPEGTLLSGAHLGVLASVGATHVRVIPRARVGVCSTGDELVDGGGPLAPGQIRDSNRRMLLGLAHEAGFEAIDLGHARDDEDVITGVLEQGVTRCDAILTSGGVSVGDYDYVKAALDRLGDLRWYQIAIKPAKPLAFAVMRGVPLFGLPGNPVSSLVSFELFARPAILQRAGHPRRFRPEVGARAGHEFTRKRDGKVHFDRVRVTWVDDGYVVRSTGDQSSNVLSAAAAANALAILPDGDGVEADEHLRVMLLDAAPDH
jgi:molybdenum cofactor synthesis domain-containing protein